MKRKLAITLILIAITPLLNGCAALDCNKKGGNWTFGGCSY